MGLFDFVGDVGKKIFGSEAEASEKIKNYIEAENPGVANLAVSVQDGVATLSGQAESAAAMEKVILMAGNIQGISEVRTDNLTAPAVTERRRQLSVQNVEFGDQIRRHRVVADGIAANYYETAVRASSAS